MNQDNKIVGIGYNRMPKVKNGDNLPWARKLGTLENKHLYGELNLKLLGSIMHLFFFMT